MSYDWSHPVIFADEFISGSSESGEAGVLGWTIVNGSWLANVAAEQNHPGIVARRCSVTPNQVASTYLSTGTQGTSCRFDEFDRCVFIFKLFATNTDFTVRFGAFNNIGSDPPGHGFYLERIAANANWTGTTGNDNVRSSTANLLAVDTNWHRVEITRDSSTQVSFSIDGGTPTAKTGNIPDAADGLVFGFQIIPTNINARDVYIDFIGFKLKAPTR
jgi:hypothetical protein